MNYDLWHLFGPVSWPIWAWLMAIVARWRNRSRLSDRLWFSGGLWCALMIGSPLGHILIRPLEAQYPVPQISKPVTGIIVLTGAERLELSTAHHQPVLNEAGERLIIGSMLQHQSPDAMLAVIGGIREKNSIRDIDVA